MSNNIFTEVWERRHLVMLFAINDVRLRYRNSVLGFLWSFLEPLLMLAVLYFVFSNIIKTGIENYPIYLLLGLIVFYMFQRATTMGQTSLLARAEILQKVYFRREIVVISSCLTAFIMMGFEFIAFGVFVVVFQFKLALTSVFLPLLLIDLFIICVGISLILSALTVSYRDLKFIWQILLQAAFFLSPIIYKLDMFPSNIQQILELNPLVTILETAHNLVLYDKLPPLSDIVYILVLTVIILIIGSVIFKAKEKKLIEEL